MVRKTEQAAGTGNQLASSCISAGRRSMWQFSGGGGGGGGAVCRQQAVLATTVR